jgi:hypothetical protein
MWLDQSLAFHSGYRSPGQFTGLQIYCLFKRYDGRNRRLSNRGFKHGDIARLEIRHFRQLLLCQPHFETSTSQRHAERIANSISLIRHAASIGTGFTVLHPL